jgi:hypothetical protein
MIVVVPIVVAAFGLIAPYLERVFAPLNESLVIDLVRLALRFGTKIRHK